MEWGIWWNPNKVPKAVDRDAIVCVYLREILNPMKFDVACENHLQYFSVNGQMTPFYVMPDNVYAVDSGGTLFKIPRTKKGASDYFDTDEVVEVNYGSVNEKEGELIRTINQFLILETERQMKYFKKPVKMGRPRKKK